MSTDFRRRLARLQVAQPLPNRRVTIIGPDEPSPPMVEGLHVIRIVPAACGLSGAGAYEA